MPMEVLILLLDGQVLNPGSKLHSLAKSVLILLLDGQVLDTGTLPSSYRNRLVLILSLDGQVLDPITRETSLNAIKVLILSLDGQVLDFCEQNSTHYELSLNPVTGWPCFGHVNIDRSIHYAPVLILLLDG